MPQETTLCAIHLRILFVSHHTTLYFTTNLKFIGFAIQEVEKILEEDEPKRVKKTPGPKTLMNDRKTIMKSRGKIFLYSFSFCISSNFRGVLYILFILKLGF